MAPAAPGGSAVAAKGAGARRPQRPDERRRHRGAVERRLERASAPGRRRVEAARGAELPAASIMSAIGVIPAIGSLPNGKA